MSVREEKLGNLCLQIRGIAYGKDEIHEVPLEDTIPLLRATNILESGEIDAADVLHVNAGCVNPKQILKKGDVLISASTGSKSSIGKPARVRRDDGVTFGAFCKALRPNTKLIDPDYFWFVFCRPEYRSYISNVVGGANINNIRNEHIDEFVIPLPPLATQQHIARVLEQADQLRKQAQQMESELNQLAQSLFLEMFGDPVNNEKAWPQFALAQLTTKIGSGATPTGGKEAYQDIGISLIRSLNVHDGEFLYKNLARIDDQQANALSNVVVEPQDVLLNITGASVCRCCVVPHDVLPARVNQHVAILRPDNVKLTSAYLQALIVSSSFKASLLQLAGAAGATREALTKGALEALLIPTPPLDKQIEYGMAMNSISMQIDVIKRKQAQLNSLFESLMQRAFNGELTTPERKAA